MRPLKLGSRGNAVLKWQAFLRGQGEPVIETGKFDDLTEQATKNFQKKSKLSNDGIVGNETIGKAASLGFEVVSFIDSVAQDYPALPSFSPLVSNKERQAIFGPLEFEPAPTNENPERIRITNQWDQQNIANVKLDTLIGKKGAPSTGIVQFNKKASTALNKLFSDWQAAGLIDQILTWDGSYVPRFVRGSRTVLSNHAFGTAFDINADWNRRGVEPAWPGEKGCLFDLVPIAHKNGFYWGGHFDTRDGMHFEWAG
jgi:peptidoglycan hydrolase-like protein with peptidoglycan-binding domain